MANQSLARALRYCTAFLTDPKEMASMCVRGGAPRVVRLAPPNVTGMTLYERMLKNFFMQEENCIGAPRVRSNPKNSFWFLDGPTNHGVNKEKE